MILAQHFGCARWWYNYALGLVVNEGVKWSKNKFIKMLPGLKKSEETSWLKDCYSQVLQYQMLRLQNAFDGCFKHNRGYPNFKRKNGRQSIGFPANVKIVKGDLKFPGKIGVIDTRLHR